MKHVKTGLFVLLLAAVCSLLSACGSSMMKPADTMHEPDSDHTVVTFFRPSVFGGAIQFSLWDGEQFIGILSARSYVQYKTTPGEHLFMAHAENWSYVKADLKAGKNYYIIGKVFPGAWKARVGLDAVNQNENQDAQVDSWLTGLKNTTVIPEKVDQYVQPRREQVRRAVNDFTAKDVKFSELKPEDGR